MAKSKHVLNVVTREANGSASARRLRKQGLIPAVIYSKGAVAETVAVSAREWEAVSKYELNLLSLIENGKETLVLLKEVQNDFMRNQAMHLDFMEVKNDQKITAHVALHAGHEAPAGTVMGGILEQNIHEIEVECLPADLPEQITIDVSKLNVGDLLHVADLEMPQGVKVVTHGDVVAFTVIDPNAVADEAAAEGGTEPEVIGEKKAE